MSTQRYYSLEVVRVEGTKKKAKEPPTFVQVEISKTVHETGHIDNKGVPAWNATFTFSHLDISESFHVSLWQQRKGVFLDDYRNIGLGNIKVADLVQNADVDSRRLRLDPGPAGAVYLRLKELSVSDRVDRAGAHVKLAERSGERVKTARDGAQYTMGVVGSVVDALGDIVKVIDEVTKLHPLLELSWRVISVLYKVVSHQFQIDSTLLEMVERMREAFSFIETARDLEDRTKGLKPQIMKLLGVTIECSRFVQEYASHNFFGRIFQWDAGKKIKHYTERFAAYKKEVNYAVAFNVAKGLDALEARKILDTLMAKLDVSKLSGLPRCHKDTRVKLLDDIKKRLLSGSGRNMVWLTGAAGSGKSTIAMTISDICDKRRCPAAYLFFERGKDGHVSAIRAIADRLATIHESIRPYIVCATELNPNITGSTLRTQFEKLLLEPLQAAAPTLDKPVTIVFDALDESGPGGERDELVQLLKTEFSKLPPKIRTLVTTRSENDIINGLQSTKHIHRIELQTKDSRDEVSTYIRQELMKAVDQQTPANWTWDDITRVLSDAADGLFIWASTAVKMVRGSLEPVKKLEELLDNVRSVGGGIDNLYLTVLEQSRIPWEESNYRDIFANVLGTILFAKEALPSSAIAALHDLREDTVNNILNRLTSVLSQWPGKPVRLHHASFADYLTKRSHGKPWRISKDGQRDIIVKRCFDIMREKLRFNICNIPTSFLRNDDVAELLNSIQSNIPPHLDYACRFWSTHFCELPDPSGFMDKLEAFAYDHLLYWFEVLSLKKRFRRVAPGALRDVCMKVPSSRTELSSFLWSAYRMANIFANPMSQSVPHIYLSAISLWQNESRVADHYSKTHPVVRVHRVGKKMPAPCMKILHERSNVWSVAFSPDGKRVVCGCEDRMIRIWDPDSGELVAGPFKGHEDRITSVAYSPDGKHIVSGSHDKTIRIWDANSGKPVAGPFKGHNNWITSVAYSPDGKHIVSGSVDKTIRIWAADSGKPVGRPFKGHGKRVTCVAYSPDGKRIASGSFDQTICIWDTVSGDMVVGPLKKHTDVVTSVAYSHDGRRLVSGSEDRKVCVWDADNGKLIADPITIGSAERISSVALSPDGRHVASGSLRIRIWDLNNGKLVAGPFKGHTERITSIVYAPDGKRLVSCSYDKKIRVWDPDSGKLAASQFVDHTAWIRSVAFSPNTKLIASGSQDNTVRLWDAYSGKPVTGPLKGHTGFVTSVAYSPDGKRLVSGSADKTIRVWKVDASKAETDKFIMKFTGHTKAVTAVAYSTDAKYIVSGSEDAEIRIWDANSGKLVAGPLKGHTDRITSVAYLPNRKRVVSGSRDKTIRIWDTESGKLVGAPFEGHASGVAAISCSLDGRRIVSGSVDKTIRVWDADRGNLVAGPFVGHTARIRSVSLSPDAKHIVSGSYDKTIRVWDAESGKLVAGPFTGHTEAVTAVAYSSDGRRFVSGSADVTIRVWELAPVAHLGGHGTKEQRIFSNWKIRWDGWVIGAGGELLAWIPEDMRGSLWRPQNTAFFSCQFSLRLDFEKSPLGEDWCKGFPRQRNPTSKVNGRDRGR